MKEKKKVELVQVFSLIKSGLSPAKISKIHKIPKGTLAYHLDKLKKLGCIEKKGYGVWDVIKDLKEVRKVPKDTITGKINKSRTSHQKQIRGHAFIWKIEFYEDILWEKFIKASKMNYQLICNKKVFRIVLNGRKIWLTKKGMIIYEPIDFLGRSSFQVKGTAVYEMDQLVKILLKKLKIKFRPYKFTTSREHYAMIKNKLAKQYNDKKEKLFVYGEDGGVWLWIDHSHGVHELETQDPVISRKIQRWYNSHKKTNFDVTPEFVLKAMKEQGELIGQNALNHKHYAKNLQAHVQSVKDLGAGVGKQNKIFERIAIVLEKLEK